jgi:hypothetical protein
MVEDLENLSSKELHDRAVERAARHLDVGFLWRLLRAIPAARLALSQAIDCSIFGSVATSRSCS